MFTKRKTVKNFRQLTKDRADVARRRSRAALLAADRRLTSPFGLVPGFPKKMVMRHKYTEYVNVTSTTGTVGFYQYCANGMYDPNLTAAGHQPLYFDQMTAIYDHYCVTGAKIKVTFSPSTQQNVPIGVGIFVNDDTSTTATQFQSNIEQSTGSVAVLAPNQQQPVVLTKGWSAKKYFVNKDPLADTDLQGTASANPTDISVFQLVVQSIDGGTATVNVTCLVEIEYFAVWKELKDIAGS